MARTTRLGSRTALLFLSLWGGANLCEGVAPLNAQEFAVPKRAGTIILEATNAYRAEHGVHPLRLSPAASKVARDEFPNEDVTVRGAVSIGRELSQGGRPP